MKENFITSIVSTWSNSISEYFKLLQEYPIKLVSLILDLAIVIFIVVKMFQIAKGSINKGNNFVHSYNMA